MLCVVTSLSAPSKTQSDATHTQVYFCYAHACMYDSSLPGSRRAWLLATGGRRDDGF
jgi:hypothetical protein